MAAAVDDKHARVGMVASIQTFSDNLIWNPHLHCVVSRGVWHADGQWIPVPYSDTLAAEILFREKVFRLLREEENTPERDDPQPTTTKSTPPNVKPFADDGPT